MPCFICVAEHLVVVIIIIIIISLLLLLLSTTILLPSPPLSQRRYYDARRHAVCVRRDMHTALVSAAKVMRSIQCSLVSSHYYY